MFELRKFLSFSIRPFLNWSRFFVVLTLSALACGAEFDPTIHPWNASATPENICPGDLVTLSWDVSPSLCTDCNPQVHVSSEPAEVLGEDITTTDLLDSSSVSVSEDTTFTFSVSGTTEAFDPKTSSVKVILPARETLVGIIFQAYCSGSAAAFTEKNLSVPVWRAQGVRPLRFCNPPGDTIIGLRLTFEDGAVLTWSLAPGQCTTPDLTPEQGRAVVKASITTSSLGTARCTASSTSPGTSTDLPPAQRLNAVLTCDL